MTPTNKTTNDILQFLFTEGIFAWRHSAGAIPVAREGVVVGFRSAGKAGVPDIVGLLAPGGRFLGIEIKTGRDRLSDVQLGFHKQARDAGALIITVKDYPDFLQQWTMLISKEHLRPPLKSS